MAAQHRSRLGQQLLPQPTGTNSHLSQLGAINVNGDGQRSPRNRDQALLTQVQQSKGEFRAAATQEALQQTVEAKLLPGAERGVDIAEAARLRRSRVLFRLFFATKLYYRCI
jgi:hypothetical protein